MRSFIFAAILVVLQVQPRPMVIYDAPVDDAYNLRVISTMSAGTLLRVLLVDRTNADRFWEVTAMVEPDERRFKVERADRQSVVLSRVNGDYGTPLGFVKLFFDIPSKRLLKRIDFAPNARMKDVAASEVLNAGLDPRIFDALKGFSDLPDFEKAILPEPLQRHALPQSTFADFRQTRPARVRDGYNEKSFRIDEKIGPYQRAANRIWFGKSFYDAEGLTGIGGIGYFDVTTNTYKLPRIPELFEWSVMAILVDGDYVWCGLKNLTEGESASGGLLRYDVKTSAVRVYPVEDTVLKIIRSGDVLALATTNGIYLLKDDRFSRYRVEPDIRGRFVLVLMES
jgi:hypothetical protein